MNVLAGQEFSAEMSLGQWRLLQKKRTPLIKLQGKSFGTEEGCELL